MTRYYYTDPVAAAWMAKHFGMRFVDEAGEVTEWYNHSDVSSTGNTYYIHPDSLHQLEPIAGDIVLNCDDDPARVVADKKSVRYCEVSLRDAKKYVGTEAEIIQRDGKAFHWPEVEA